MKKWLKISIAVLVPAFLATALVLAILVGPWILGAAVFLCFLIMLGLVIYFELE